MKLTIIGSGSAVIRKERKAPSMVLEVGKKILLFDCGWGCGVNLLEAGFDIQKIDHIFITHPHADHLGNLPNILQSILVRGFFYREKRTKPLYLHGYRGFKQDLKILLKMMVPEPHKWGFPFPVKIYEYSNSSRKIDNFIIKSKEVKHVPMFFKAVSFRIESGKKVFVYSGDLTYDENLIKLSKNADLAAFETSVPIEYFQKRGKAPSHLSPFETGEIAQKAGAKKLVLFHLYDVNTDKQIKKEIEENYKGQLIIPKDLQKISV